MELKHKIADFRYKLGLIFDDNLGTRQWYNIVDWIIVFMILLSSVEIFLATFSWPAPIPHILDIINEVTLWFFVVEVTLRIWAAPEKGARFKGLKGRVRYCFTFYGFIDMISTYPFLIHYFVPLPVNWLKVLRTARIIRIFRITRYAKSFNLLFDSIREKRNELIVSMQFLFIVTFILSLILYFHEHDAQPDVYDDGFVSVIWAFAQYIGDPGEFADTPPVTFVGKAIACVIGLLGIAIVAVPAGILGAGFTETIEREIKKKEIDDNALRLRLAFERKLDRPTGYQACPPYRSITDIQTRLGLSENEIIEAVKNSDSLRLVNLASTIPVINNRVDRLAVEFFEHNRPYGLFIDRGSRFTVIAPSSFIDACTGFFGYYLAMIGGFNYVSREYGEMTPYRSFYSYKSTPEEHGFKEYHDDIRQLLSRQGAWSLTSLVSSGALEPEYDTDIHFGTGSAKGVEEIGNLVTNKKRFMLFYNNLSATLAGDEDVKCDIGRYHNTSTPNLFLRKIAHGTTPNDFIMRTSWRLMLWSPRRLEIARIIAEAINKEILGLDGNPEVKRLKVKDFGYQ